MSTFIGSDDPITVSAESMQARAAEEVIWSNIEFVNALLKEYLHRSEVSHEALLSYYVDYYLAQVDNGGFAQFVFNSRWEPAVVSLVREGLAAMGASKHATLFDEGASIVGRKGSKLVRFLKRALFGRNAERERYSVIDPRFDDLKKVEDLTKINAAWIRARPNLRVVPRAELRGLVKGRASLIPDLEKRVAIALAAEPVYKKRMRALCKAAGHTFDRATALDPTHEYRGKPVMAWHFLTDQGHHLMVEADGMAMMFKHESQGPLVVLPLR